MRKVGFILILLVFFSSISYADVKIDRIAVIDLKKVIEVVFSGVSNTISSIKREREDLQEKLDKMKENINKLEELKLKTDDASRKQNYQERIDKIKKDYSDFYKVKSYQIEKKLENAQSSSLKEIYNAVKRVAEREGFTIVLDADDESIFFYSVDADITDMAIKFFDDRYGEKEEEEEEE